MQYDQCDQKVGELVGLRSTVRRGRRLGGVAAHQRHEQPLHHFSTHHLRHLFEVGLPLAEAERPRAVVPVEIVEHVEEHDYLDDQEEGGFDDHEGCAAGEEDVGEFDDEVEGVLADLGEEEAEDGLADHDGVVPDELEEVEVADGGAGGEVDVAVLVAVVASAVARHAELRLLAQVHVLVLLVVEQYISAVLLHHIHSVENILLVPPIPHQYLLLLKLPEHAVQIRRLLVQYFRTHLRYPQVEDIGVDEQIGYCVDRLEHRFGRFGGWSQNDDIGHHLGRDEIGGSRATLEFGHSGEVKDRLIQDGVLGRIPYLLLVELVHEHQQTHRLHLANVLVQVFVEGLLVVTAASVGLLDLGSVHHVQGQFCHQLDVEPFLVLQLTALDGVLHLLAVALVQDGFGVPSDQHQDALIVLRLFLLHSLQKDYFVWVFVDGFDMKQLSDQKVSNTGLPHGILILPQIEMLPGSLLNPKVIALVLHRIRIPLGCGQECHLHEILHSLDVFDADGLAIDVSGHEVVVYLFDADGVQREGGVVSEGVDCGDNGVHFVHFRDKVVIFDRQREDYFLVVQKFLVSDGARFHKRVRPLILLLTRVVHFDHPLRNIVLSDSPTDDHKHFEHGHQKQRYQNDVIREIVDEDVPYRDRSARYVEGTTGQAEGETSQDANTHQEEVEQHHEPNG